MGVVLMREQEEAPSEEHSPLAIAKLTPSGVEVAEEKEVPPTAQEKSAHQEAAVFEEKELPPLAVQRSAREAVEGLDEKEALPPPEVSLEPSTMEIHKIEEHGAVSWEVSLSKREGLGKYGFAHGNGKTEYIKRRGVRENASTILPNDAGIQPEDFGPEVLLVKRVTQGTLIDEWNKLHPDAQVRVGDLIAEVNGNSKIDGMQRELRCAHVRLKVVRQTDRFQISLRKRDGARKLGFNFEKRGEVIEGLAPALRITEIKPVGLLEEVNLLHMSQGKFHLVVIAGMRIEAVNDIEGDLAKMGDLLRTAEELKIRIRRPEAVPEIKQAVTTFKAMNKFRALGARKAVSAVA